MISFFADPNSYRLFISEELHRSKSLKRSLNKRYSSTQVDIDNIDIARDASRGNHRKDRRTKKGRSKDKTLRGTRSLEFDLVRQDHSFDFEKCDQNELENDCCSSSCSRCAVDSQNSTDGENTLGEVLEENYLHSEWSSIEEEEAEEPEEELSEHLSEGAKILNHDVSVQKCNPSFFTLLDSD